MNAAQEIMQTIRGLETDNKYCQTYLNNLSSYNLIMDIGVGKIDIRKLEMIVNGYHQLNAIEQRIADNTRRYAKQVGGVFKKSLNEIKAIGSHTTKADRLLWAPQIKSCVTMSNVLLIFGLVGLFCSFGALLPIAGGAKILFSGGERMFFSGEYAVAEYGADIADKLTGVL